MDTHVRAGAQPPPTTEKQGRVGSRWGSLNPRNGKGRPFEGVKFRTAPAWRRDCGRVVRSPSTGDVLGQVIVTVRVTVVAVPQLSVTTSLMV